MVIVLLNEVGNFSSSSIEVGTFIENDVANSEYAILSINMTVFNVPCTGKHPQLPNFSVLTAEFTNDIQTGDEELVSDKLTRRRLFPNGTEIIGDDVYEKVKAMTEVDEIEEILREEIVIGESCNFFGIIQLHRANGNIHFASNKRDEIVRAAENVDGLKTFVHAHEVYSLQFSTSLKHILSEGNELQDNFEQDQNVFDRIKDLDI